MEISTKQEEEQQNVRDKDEKEKLNISLRRFEPSDLDDYMVWASDDKVTRFCTWDTFTSKDDLLAYMNQSVFPHPWLKAICLGDGRPVGYILMTRSTGAERCRGEIGYVLASAHWGKGIATEAVKVAVESLFGELEGLERVEAFVDVDNVGSLRVLEKAGFVREAVMRKFMILKGSIRDMVIFSFVRD